MSSHVRLLNEIFCSMPILQFPNPSKDYVLYTDTSHNAYSGVLCQLQDKDNDIRPVAYFSGTFTAQNKSWCATEKISMHCTEKHPKIGLLPKRCELHTKM